MLQGLDAFSGVSKLMEGLAHTLDDVIGQAFKEWGTPVGPPGGEVCRRAQLQGVAGAGATESWGDFDGGAEWETPSAAGSKRDRPRRGGHGPRPGHTISPFLSRLNAASDILERSQDMAAVGQAGPGAGPEQQASTCGTRRRLCAGEEDWERGPCPHTAPFLRPALGTGRTSLLPSLQ